MVIELLGGGGEGGTSMASFLSYAPLARSVCVESSDVDLSTYMSADVNTLDFLVFGAILDPILAELTTMSCI